jgi:hypothetical protein
MNFFMTGWLAGYGAYFWPASHQNRDIWTPFDSLTVNGCTLLFFFKLQIFYKNFFLWTKCEGKK